MGDFRHSGNVSKEEIVLDQIYLVSNHHRDGNQNKSMWELNQKEELDIFENMLKEGWFVDCEGWSILRKNDSNEIVGKSRSNSYSKNRVRRSLKVAMFEDGSGNSKWHGYPADYLNVQDRPSSKVFDMWIAKELISKACKRRFQRGKGDIK